ncbi:MAG: SpoVA/SpoVAEb family sporulation membrane protein [Clostridia bacterium]|nr:SpoVA/SpoVAEb family sporulation membrane protein [Clostridia bacterium]
MDSEKRNVNYNMYVDAKVPKTKLWPSVLRAFLVGGIICVIGQGFFDFYAHIFPNMSEANITAMMLITVIVITQFLTGLGIYDYVGMFGGSGSVIPITGFANSIASPAIEFKKEGIIYGICVKMFTIAGPVIVCGTVGSILVGLVYLFIV